MIAQCACGCGGMLKQVKFPSQQKRFLLGHGKRVPLANRFWKKAEKSEHCWTWIAGKNSMGYGTISDDCGKQKAAHRIAWEFTYGKIPENMAVLHKCDNPACVRPDHLALGTIAENNLDCVIKGRKKSAKLYAHFDEIINLRAAGLSYKKIADMFNVHANAIFLLIKGRTYQWRQSL